MIFTARFIILLLIGALMIGFSGWVNPLLPGGIALICLTIAAALGEWLHLKQNVKLEINRICDEKLSLGTANPVRIRLRNAQNLRVKGAVRDEYPDGMESGDNVIPIDMGQRSEADVLYHVLPLGRGDFEFGNIYVRVMGPIGLIIRQIMYPMKQSVKVYPNLLDMKRYEIELRHEHTVQPGQKIVRMRGRGTEFEQLREYVPDDEFRSVDWKASARRGKLVTRQYQEEKAQNVMIVLDSGRVMGPVLQGLTKLDHSINAAMMLAHVASIRGDKVGLMTFAEDIINFSAPKAGKSQTLSLLSLTYNLKDASGDSNYYRAIPYFTRKWTRRSLVVFFTDLVDPESSKPLISQISSLARKHLCMCVAMADPAIVEAANGPFVEPADAYKAAAARQALQARKLAAAQLTRLGAVVLDVTPDSFTPAVVNEYLNIKSRGVL